MRWPPPKLGSLILLSFLLAASPAPPAAAASIEDFAGSWQGEGDDGSGERLTLTLDGGGGFHASWTEPGAGADTPVLEAGFAPSDRPNVYSYAPETGSLLSRMFAAPASGNPLAGETLLWARLDQETLSIYSLAVADDGGFELDLHRWTLEADALLLHFSRRTQTLEETVIEGRLQAAGE